MSHESVRIPPGLNDEDPFLIVSNMKFSLRQMITLAGGVMVWFSAGQAIAIVLGTFIFGLILTAPILVIAGLMAFLRREGKPIELWLADKLIFLMTPREYSLTRSRGDDEWEEDDFVI